MGILLLVYVFLFVESSAKIPEFSKIFAEIKSVELLLTDANKEQITELQSAESSPGYLLLHVSMLWRKAIEEVLKSLNLTHPQFVILATTAWLTRKGDIVSQVDVSRAASLDPNTTSQILKGLEKKNLIRRVRSVNDRSKNPELTALGKKRLALAMPAVEEADESFFIGLKSKQIKSLLESFMMLLSKE